MMTSRIRQFCGVLPVRKNRTEIWFQVRAVVLIIVSVRISFS